MKIKIMSEGLGRNTKIINAETGEIIEDVRSAKWECDAGGMAKVMLELVNIPVDLQGELDISQFGDTWKKILKGDNV